MKKTLTVLAVAGSIFTMSAASALACDSDDRPSRGGADGGGWLDNGPDLGLISFAATLTATSVAGPK